MDSVDILWFIEKNLGGGKERPPWYFEAQEYSRYWKGLKINYDLLMMESKKFKNWTFHAYLIFVKISSNQFPCEIW